MDLNNISIEEVLQKLKTTEAIMDILIAQVDELCYLTDKNGPLNKVLDETLQMTYNKKLPSRTCQQRKDKLRKVSKKIGKPRPSKSI